ncbi:hypothetical protein CVT25_013462 [Psilocybe cyanescens]|uniref:Uncharacterized protein n=1 Tax=Psilocybe cyanescens TaxID=93625 RepID=A0A409WTP4_PSICY|nr:hypothetical protein CVT25_013462 [Psilocybe cyanescens]
MSAQIFFIDDRNPGMSYISAQGENSSWSQEENVLEFNQTATWTDREQASVSIPFNGTAISVWGTLSGSVAGPVLTSYQVDGLPIINVENSSLVDEPQFQVMFYQSPGLKPGMHNLLITNMANGSLFRFDFVKVVPQNDTFNSDVRPPPTSSSTSTEVDSSTPISSTFSLDRDTFSVPTSSHITSPHPPSSSDPTTSTTLMATSDSTDTSSSPTTSTGNTSTAMQSSNAFNHVRIAPILWFYFAGDRGGREAEEGEINFSDVRKDISVTFLPSVGTSSEDLQPFELPKSDLHADGAGLHLTNEVSRHELSPSNDPFASSQDVTLERSVWSPEPTKRAARGISRINGFRQSPPKYNSGLFYHLDPV